VHHKYFTVYLKLSRISIRNADYISSDHRHPSLNVCTVFPVDQRRSRRNVLDMRVRVIRGYLYLDQTSMKKPLLISKQYFRQLFRYELLLQQLQHLISLHRGVSPPGVRMALFLESISLHRRDSPSRRPALHHTPDENGARSRGLLEVCPQLQDHQMK